jgi:hypothetical protein
VVDGVPALVGLTVLSVFTEDVVAVVVSVDLGNAQRTRSKRAGSLSPSVRRSPKHDCKGGAGGARNAGPWRKANASETNVCACAVHSAEANAIADPVADSTKHAR